MTKKRYLQVGSVVEFNDKDGNPNPTVSLEAENLKEFVDYITNFGAKYLKGLTTDEIRAGVKDKTIPRIYLNYYDPHEQAPDFIKHNLVLKLTEL